MSSYSRPNAAHTSSKFWNAATEPACRLEALTRRYPRTCYMSNRFQSSDGISPPKAPIATRKPLNAKETKSTQSLVTVIDSASFHLLLQLVQQVQRLQRAEAVQVRFLDAVHDLLRQRREDGQLHRRGLASFIVGQMADRAPLGALMLGQYLARSVDDVGGQPGQLGHFDAVALVGRALLHLAQKNNPAATLFYPDAEVLHPAEPVGQFGQLVIVSGGGCLGARVGVDVLDGRPRDGEAIVGRSTSSHLIEQDERARRGRV